MGYNGWIFWCVSRFLKKNIFCTLSETALPHNCFLCEILLKIYFHLKDNQRKLCFRFFAEKWKYYYSCTQAWKLLAECHQLISFITHAILITEENIMVCFGLSLLSSNQASKRLVPLSHWGRKLKLGFSRPKMKLIKKSLTFHNVS